MIRTLLVSLAAGCLCLSPVQSRNSIRLVVFIVVDQLKPDLLERYDPLFTGGFRWLSDHGTRFTQAFHEHAFTATGPGHFTLASGRYPGPAGQIGNQWYDRRTQRLVYCVEDSLARIPGTDKPGSSYRNVHADALGDWIKAAYPGSRVFSLSGKDRAAVLLGGKAADAVIWYDWAGSFVTSDYYVYTAPAWLTAFNHTTNIPGYRDSLWTLSVDPEQAARLARPDHQAGEADYYHAEKYSPVFPIGFNGDLIENELFSRWGGFPWLDKVTLQLAETIVRSEKLGQDDTPDLLAISLSATDIIGHYYGPESLENLDNLTKLDRRLGHFIWRVQQSCGEEQVLFVLASDHGCAPLPEAGGQGGRLAPLRDKLYRRLQDRFRRSFGTAEFVHFHGLQLYWDFPMLAQLGLSEDQLVDTLRTAAGAEIWLERVVTKAAVLESREREGLMYRLRNHVHPQLSPDVFLISKPYWIGIYPDGSTHGTPWDYDAQVPVIFAWPGNPPRIMSNRIETVDIAPTVAAGLGIRVRPGIDGKILPVFGK